MFNLKQGWPNPATEFTEVYLYCLGAVRRRGTVQRHDRGAGDCWLREVQFPRGGRGWLLWGKTWGPLLDGVQADHRKQLLPAPADLQDWHALHAQSFARCPE